MVSTFSLTIDLPPPSQAQLPENLFDFVCGLGLKVSLYIVCWHVAIGFELDSGEVRRWRPWRESDDDDGGSGVPMNCGDEIRVFAMDYWEES
ncbi:hypothetical protein QYF36_004663 [Acer negundo]|nr:hypothetical protein QYF36_004663 [Acer negundo]